MNILKLILCCAIFVSGQSGLFAAEEICISGGRALSIQKDFPMKLSLPIEGVQTKTTVLVENVIGSGWFTMLGFFTFDEVRAKYCKGTVTDTTILYYPNYKEVLGQNGFYWYLKHPKETRKVSHLYIHGGDVRDGVCQSALEGGDDFVIDCEK